MLFLRFVYGYPSSSPCAHCTPNKSMPTLHYTRRHGLIYTGHACRHLPSAVPWISEDHLLILGWWAMKLCDGRFGAMSTFSPISYRGLKWYENVCDRCVCVCARVWNKHKMPTMLACPHISSFHARPVHTRIHTHTNMHVRTRIFSYNLRTTDWQGSEWILPNFDLHLSR